MVVRELDLGEQEYYREHPVEWAEDILGLELWSFNREVLESIRDNRDTAVQSSHGPGKSFTASIAAAWWLSVWPVGDAFVVTTAPTADQVYAVLWREMRHRKREGELEGRITLDAKWYMTEGGEDELVAYGRKPADYDATAFQGIHAKAILLLMDEACGVPASLYIAGKSLVTSKHSRRVAIGNPDDPASEFAKACSPGSTWHVIQVSTFDTPAFTGEPVSDDLLDVLPTKEWQEECVVEWGEASPIYESKVLGKFPNISDDTLFPPHILNTAVWNEHLPGLEVGQLGADIARFGSDKTCVYRNRGGVIREVATMERQSTTKTKHFLEQQMNSIPNELPVNIDSIGVGAGVYDDLKEAGYPVHQFVASAASTQPHLYLNLRAQVYWEFRQACENGEVDLDPNDLKLLAQLGSMKFKFASKGRIQIESKEDMKKRGMPSPDRADAVIMSWWNSDESIIDQLDAMSGNDTVEGIMDDVLDRPM